MGDGQVRLFPQDRGNQLQRTRAQPCNLADFAFPGVMADQLVVQMKKICQLAHLKTVAGRNHDRIIALLEFFNDWGKKRKRAVSYPNRSRPFFGARSWTALRFCQRWARR